MNRSVSLMVVLLVGGACGLAHADRIWRYTDANGQVVYSNQPPKGGKATVIETPKYAPPARWSGPSWAQVFGDTTAQRTTGTGSTNLRPAPGLPSAAFSTGGQGPLPPGWRTPPSGEAPPLPPLPGSVSPPVQLPWPTVTPPAPGSTHPELPVPASSPTVNAVDGAATGRPASAPAARDRTPPPQPIAPSSPIAPGSARSSHPASAPAAAHTDHPK